MKIGDSGGLGPVAAVVTMSVEARGAEDRIEGIDGALLNALKNCFEDTANFTFAAIEEAPCNGRDGR
jgi:hypothetical protein